MDTGRREDSGLKLWVKAFGNHQIGKADAKLFKDYAIWRKLNAIRGATFMTSSPSTRTASDLSMSRRDAIRTGPLAMTSMVSRASFSSASGIPAKKRSGPTSVRKAKFDSSDARGEPMPMTLFPEAIKDFR